MFVGGSVGTLFIDLANWNSTEFAQHHWRHCFNSLYIDYASVNFVMTTCYFSHIKILIMFTVLLLSLAWCHWKWNIMKCKESSLNFWN